MDDLDIQFEYAVDIMNEKTSNVERISSSLDDLDIQFEYAFDILNDKTRNVERISSSLMISISNLRMHLTF